MRKQLFSKITISAICLLISFASTAASLVNGSFETPVISGGVGINVGDAWLTGWTVGGPSGDMFLAHGALGGFSPYDGEQYVGFGGINTASGGSLSQTITTVAGLAYRVIYYVGQSGPGNFSLTSAANDAGGSLLASNRFVSVNGSWIQCQLGFTALSTSTVLTFTDTSAVDIEGGAVTLDDINVVAEPTTGIPLIVTSPVSQTVVAGTVVSFSSTAAGSPSGIQWYFGTNTLTGATGTNSPLLVTASDATVGNYTAVFSNAYGMATSAVAVLSIIDPPIILTSPTSHAVGSGTQVAFSASAGGGTAGVQWYFINYLGSNNIAGANSTTLLITADAATAGTYVAVFSNAAGTTSTVPASLAVTGIPFTNGSFEVPVIAGGIGINVGDTWLTGWTVGGPSGDMFVAHGGASAGLTPIDGQQVVGFGGINTTAGGSLAQTFSTVAGTSFIVSYDVGQSGPGNFSFTGVAFDGGGTLLASNRCVPTNGSWTQCQLIFTAISTNATLVFTDTSAFDIQGGAVLLDDVVVVGEPSTGIPIITISPASQTVPSGSTVTFSSMAAGGPSSLQWYFGTNAVSGAAGTISPLQVVANDSTAGNYAAVFSNSYGMATSAVAVLTVIDPPVIVTSPVSQTAASGAQVTFAASSTGTTNSVQWYFINYLGTNTIVGATTTNLNVTASGSTAGDYVAVFSNIRASAATSVASLTVTGLSLTNGSFETPVISGGLGVNVGDSWLVGWTIGGPSGDMFVANGAGSAGLNPVDGHQVVGFGGINTASGGSLSQTISTVAGSGYVVDYYVGQSGPGSLSFTGTVFDAGGSLLASNRFVPTVGNWGQRELNFTAVSGNTTLVFKDTSAVDVQGGAELLDDVTAEPTSGPPVVVTSPSSVVAAAGTVVSFSSTAAGSPSTIQWFLGTNEVTNGTNSPLAVTAGDATAGNYTAVFSNSYGLATSAVAVLTVVTPPVITASPASQVATIGSQVNLNASCSGGGTAVQWYFGSTAISGATSTNLSFVALPNSAGNYSAVFSNVAGVATSIVARVTVIAGPFLNGGFESINTHATIPAGTGSVILPGATWLTGWSVSGPGNDIFVHDGTAVGFSPVDGQIWIDFNGNNTAPGGILSQTFLTTVGAPYAVGFSVGKTGTGNVSLTATAVSTNNTIIASNRCIPATGVWTQFQLNFTATTTNTTLIFTDTSAQTLGVDVTLDAVSVVTPPIVTLSPTSQEVLIGSTVTFAASATNGPTGVRWFQGTNAVLNGNNTTLSFMANAGSGGNYTAVFTNAAGSATTTVAVLTVDLPAGLSLQPASIVTNVGATVVFGGVPTGTAPFGLQWTFDGTNITGANTTNLVLTNAQPASAGSYALVVTNAYGTNTSTNAVLSFISTIQIGSASEVGAGSAVTTLTNPVTTISVTVPVNLLALGNENAVGFNLNYDVSHLSYVGATLGSGAAGGAFGVNSSETGKVGVAIILPEGTTFATGTQQLVQVTFQASLVSTPTFTPITFGDLPTPPGISDTNAIAITPLAYLSGTVSILPTGLEGDVSPVSAEDYVVGITDWVQEGRFVAGVDAITNAAEFQRADCAPRETLGDGYITVEDWVQVGRYYLGLDQPSLQGGPTNVPPLGDFAPKRGDHKFAPDDRTATVLTLTPVTQGATSTAVTVQVAAQGYESALGFSVNFDPTVLSFVNATLGSGAAGATLNVGTHNLGTGNVGIAVGYLPPQTFAAGTLNIVTLNFNSLSYSNTASLSFGSTPTRQGVSDATASPVPATYQNAVIQVGGQPWPHLAISQSGGGISFSWPSSATVLKAQWTTNLGANWTDVAATAVTNGGTIYLTLPPPPTTTFYRLSQ
jgi:hypothetical protein